MRLFFRTPARRAIFLGWSLCLLGCGSGAPTSTRGERALAVETRTVFGGSGETGPIVTTREGSVVGKYSEDGSVRLHLGIPYAQPPLGKLRYRSPKPLPAGSLNNYHATKFGSMCIQPAHNGTRIFQPWKIVGSEDCLFINVFAPRVSDPRSQLPVMVFIHGGVLVVGAGDERFYAPNESGDLEGTNLYDGAKLVKQGNVILVTFNYRLGTLGNLVHPALSAESRRGVSGNYWFQDQIEALNWIQRNIRQFGGDPGNVTIFGESAGSRSVLSHVISPKSGNFQKAILESTYVDNFRDFKKAQTEGAREMSKHCPPDRSKETANCLRALTAKDVILAHEPAEGSVVTAHGYPITIDDYYVTEPLSALRSGRYNHASLIVGTNTNETANLIPAQIKIGKSGNTLGTMSEEEYRVVLFALLKEKYSLAQILRVVAAYDGFCDKPFSHCLPSDPSRHNDLYRQLTQILTHESEMCAGRRLLQAAVQTQREPVFEYLFGYVPRGTRATSLGFGAAHGLELFYVFGNLPDLSSHPDTATDQVVVSDEMIAYWTSFAATGNPQSGSRIWPRWTGPTRGLSLQFGGINNPTTRVRWPFEERICDLWDSFRTK